MFTVAFWNPRRVCGALLILGVALMAAGIWLFGFNEKGGLIPIKGFSAYFEWQRHLPEVGILTILVALVRLDQIFRAIGDRLWSRLGLVAYLLAVPLWLTVNALSLAGKGWIAGLEADFALLTCLSSAAFGAASIRTRLLPRWVGWAAIVWSAIGIASWLFSFTTAPYVYALAMLLFGISLLMRHNQSAPIIRAQRTEVRE